MAYKKGADVLIKVFDATANSGTGAYVAVGGQQGASFGRTSESFNYNIKGDNWTYHEATYRAWEVSCNGLYVVSDTGFTALEQAFLDGSTVKVEVSFDGTTKWQGDAILVDFSVDMPQDNMVSYSLKIQGKGALTKVNS